MNVLLIEDDVFQATIISTMLESKEGIHVAVALSGEDALQMVSQSSFNADLVVCDLSMPGMDGIEMLFYLSQTLPNASYAILSAANEDVLESASNTAFAYGIKNLSVYSKPLSNEQAEQMLDFTPVQCVQATSNKPKQFDFTHSDFLAAIANKELELHYQPQVCAETSQLLGAEALVRWNHPEQGLLSPYFFLDKILEFNLGATLTEWVLQQVTKDTAQLRRYNIGCTISVNANASDVSQRSFTNKLLALMDNYKLPTSAITVEVTESEFTPDATAMLETLTRLRLSGFGVSIDDFGTGYSTLYQLATAPFSELKIDRSFVQQILTSDKHLKSVRAMCRLCEELEIKTVIEGVETEEQREALRDIGGDIFQGYYFGKPMSKSDFIEWANTNFILCHCAELKSA